MAVGEARHLDHLKSEALKWHPKGAERAAWAQVFLSLLTQVRCAGEQGSNEVVESSCNHRGDNNKRQSCEDPKSLLCIQQKLAAYAYTLLLQTQFSGFFPVL